MRQPEQALAAVLRRPVLAGVDREGDKGGERDEQRHDHQGSRALGRLDELGSNQRDHDPPSHSAGGSRPTVWSGRVAGREQLQEGVFEPLRRHDRVESQSGRHERGREIRSSARPQLDDQSVALDLRPFVTAGSCAENRGALCAIVDLDVHGTRRADQLADGAVGDEAAVVHHEHVAARLLDLAQVMARQQHRRTVATEPADQLTDLTDLAGIETVGRLVEHQQLGPAEQQPGEPETLLHALRVRLHLAVDRRSEVGDRERAVEIGVLHRCSAGGLPPQPQVLHPRQVGHELGLFDHRPHAHEVRSAGRHRLAEQERTSAATAVRDPSTRARWSTCPRRSGRGARRPRPAGPRTTGLRPR